jgi:GT2 family glycosyltransferase
LRALAFADEILVVDKSSTDGTAEIAATLADRVISVPWSPVVEDTRAFAIAQCKYDWVLCLDDDECLSAAAIDFFRNEMLAPRAKVYAIPQRHYILGRHDEQAYYWPEHQVRFFDRKAIDINPAVHGGFGIKTDALHQISPDSGICLHHLSHKDVSQWIEKTNRYTSISNRVSEDDGGRDLIGFAHAKIDGWAGRSTIEDRGSYPAAVAVLRAVYDIIDRLKLWESEEEGGDDAAFEVICRKLDAEYTRIYGSGSLHAPHPARAASVEVMDHPGQPEDEQNLDRDAQVPASRARLLRQIIETTRKQADNALSELAAAKLRLEQVEAMRRQLEERLAAAERLYATRLEAEWREAKVRLVEQRQIEARLDSILSSEFWKITAPLRFVISLFRGLVIRNGHRVRVALRALKPTNIDHRREVLRALRRRVTAVIGHAPPMSDAAIRAQHVRSRGIANRVAPKSIKHLPPHEAAVASYPLWSRRFDTPTAIELGYLDESRANLPEIHIVARFSGETHHLIDRTVKALKTSIGIRWNAVFTSDGADHNFFRMACAEAFQDDTRFHLQDAHPDLMSEFIVLLEAGAIPRSHGIRLLIEPMLRNSDLALVYSDEDRLSPAGLPEFPWLKPEYDPLLAAQGMLFGRMFAIRTDHTRGRPAFRMILDPGSSILEIATEITRDTSRDHIGHVAHVLFHDLQPPAPVPHAITPPLETLPIVSVIIPSRDRWDFLGPCLASLRITDWPADRLEIIVVDNGSTDIEVLENLFAAEARNEIRVIRDNRKFNYAALNNLAAKAARGDVFVLLNNDTEIIDPAWLRKLCAYAVLPDVGAVGAKLLYSDRTVQHGGVILGIQGVAGHAHLFLDEDEGGYQQLANVTHEVAAVTGACLAVSRVAFETVGGLREEFAVAFNDVLFCMDLHDAGRRNIYVADCVLIHHESKTRGFDTTPRKIEIARSETLRTWRYHSALMRDDPCYSPNLSLESPYELGNLCVG